MYPSNYKQLNIIHFSILRSISIREHSRMETGITIILLPSLRQRPIIYAITNAIRNVKYTATLYLYYWKKMCIYIQIISDIITNLVNDYTRLIICTINYVCHGRISFLRKKAELRGFFALFEK